MLNAGEPRRVGGSSNPAVDEPCRDRPRTRRSAAEREYYSCRRVQAYQYVRPSAAAARKAPPLGGQPRHGTDSHPAWMSPSTCSAPRMYQALPFRGPAPCCRHALRKHRPPLGGLVSRSEESAEGAAQLSLASVAEKPSERSHADGRRHSAAVAEF
jgi:hypothetical protein